MEAPHLPNTALPQGSSSLPPNPGFSQANIEVRYLIRGDVLQVYRLMCISRLHLLREEHDDMNVTNAEQVMPSAKATCYIYERSTIPKNASFAILHGLAPTRTVTTS